MAELEAWDRIERSRQVDWDQERDLIVGLLVTIANQLGAGLEPELYLKRRAASSTLSPDAAVRAIRQAFA